jgi:tripartite-type tricarboxylate transporter receptor subunit TctC
MVPVHYRGAAQAIPDLMAGRVQVMFDIVVSSLSYINAGQLRPLAVATPAPHELLPGIQTIGETLPGFGAGGWQGVCAPSKTPADIVDMLNREINTVLADPKLKTRLVELGGQPTPGTPADFGKFIASETDKWGKVVREAGLKTD